MNTHGFHAGHTIGVRGADLERIGEELGLDVVGAAPAVPYEETERHIRERRERGLFADMKFTMARPEESCHPERLLPGARTVVSAALCYYAEEPARPRGHGRLPRYTWSDAYAELREKLDALGRRLGGSYRVLVDANQHVDREAAARSGVGFYGKNTLLITRRHGSWVVLGTLVTDVELEPTRPLALDCGSCRLCIDACPTGALDEPGTLDSTRCLSYWTQSSQSIPEEYREPLGAQVYGCDICQDVCPWNRGVGAASSLLRAPSRTSRWSTGSGPSRTICAAATSGCTCRATTAAGCSETRSSPRATSAAPTSGPRPSRTSSTRTPTCASTRAGRSHVWRRGVSERVATERWLAWIRLVGVVVAVLKVGIFTSYYPGGYGDAAWIVTAVFAVGAFVLFWLAHLGKPEWLRWVGFSALLFDTAIIGAYAIVFSYGYGNQTRWAMLLPVVEAALRYGLVGGIVLPLALVPYFWLWRASIARCT